MRCARNGCNTAMVLTQDDFGSVYSCPICGNYQVVERIIGNIVVTHTPKSTEIVLPKRGTKLSKTLGTLASSYPAYTSEIASMTRQGVNETTSQLSALVSRGLVTKVEQGRGNKGGSSWALTKAGHKALKL